MPPPWAIGHPACMLAYYVEWHLKEAWREMLFADEDQAVKTTRDPVAPAERSAGAKAKIARRHHADGTPIHSFQTLLADLATIVRNTCLLSGVDDASPFTITTQPTPFQQRPWSVWRTSRCSQYEEPRCPDSRLKYQGKPVSTGKIRLAAIHSGRKSSMARARI